MIRIKNNLPARLPSEYQEVEYLEDSGTQYIDTGVPNSSAITVVAEKQFSGVNKLCGIDYTVVSYYRFKWGTNGDGYLYYGYGTSNYASTTKPDTTKWYRFTMGYGNQKIEDIATGTVIKSSTATMSDYHSTYGIHLFAVMNTYYNRIDTATGGSKIRSTKIYDNDTLIRDFVPCYRKTDNEPGMYDLVNNTFYTNAGSGTFLMGNEVGKRDLNINPAMAKENPNPIKLPSEYQELDYIQSTGTQYIDTGYLPNDNSKFELVISDCVAQKDNVIFIASSTWAANTFNFLNSAASFWWHYPGAVEFGNGTLANKNTISLYRGQIKLNGAVISDNTSITTQKTIQQVSIFGNSYLSSYRGKLKLYSFKIYENDTLARDLVPCYRKSDNVAGLYDLVNGTFYTNAGSGTFTIGNEVIYKPFVLSPLTRGYIQDKLFYGEAPKKGRFVCVAANGNSYYSIDGETWASMSGLPNSSGVTYNYYCVAYGNGKYVTATGYTQKRTYCSTDGETWVETGGVATNYMRGVCYGKDRFVITGSYGNSYYSTDGINWTAMTGLASAAYHSVTYGGDRFVTVGDLGKSYYSTDGVTWTAMSTMNNSQTYYGVAYGNGIFVSVGTKGYVYYNTGGTSWNTGWDGIGSENIYGVTYGKDRFVCVGASGKSYYSTDGATWTAMSGLDNTTYRAVCYNNDRFVTVGYDGKSYYSLDGLTWTAMTGLASAQYCAVCFGEI